MRNTQDQDYHKVCKTKHSSLLVITKYVPKDWKLVRVTLQGNSDNAVVLRIERVA